MTGHPPMTDNRQPIESDPSRQGGELSFADIVAFFQRHWRLIFGAAFAAGLLTALTVILFIPRKYEAAATLIIVPPKFASDLKPSTLTVQGYQQLLESDAVIAEARRRLIARGVLKTDDLLRLGREIDTKIFASRRAEETVLAPMLQAVARGRSAEQAAAIANEWATVFLERTRQLMAGPTSATVELIDKQYPEARSAVEKLEQQRNDAQTGLQQRFDDTVTRWDDTITSYKNQTADLVAAYRAETRRILESFSATKNLETRRVRLDAMRRAYGDLQSEQTRVNSQLEQRKLELEAVRKQLAVAPQYLEIHKAITDDALWQSLANAKGKTDQDVNWPELQQRSLVSQQLNPMYQELATRASKVETDVFTLVPRAEQLKGETARLSVEVQQLGEEYGADASELEKLSQERDAGLEKLQEDRSNGLGELTRNKQRALDDITREREARLAGLGRDISHEQELYGELAKAYNQAVLAKAQENVEDVRLGAPAVPPETPKPRGGATKALLAAILGGMLGLFVALVREAAVKTG
ncbi:MAG: hypothetical protein EPN53_04840 [Acidobacteria bacterium]|nr:MAG: hypothetical protein EPN53_04840 [Acidobacteriota bacterium]